MKTSLVLLASASLLCATAHAQDKATLDLLVKKGLITQAEADATAAETAKAKEAAPAPVTLTTAANSIASKVTVGGLVQGRYTGISQSDSGAGRSDPAGTNGFSARRVLLNFDVQLKNGWGLFISPEMDGSPNTGSGVANSSTFYLDKAGVSYTCDAGTAVGGLKKVNFGLDEYGSSATSLTNERSVATQYLATTQFASRHTGIFWDGKVKDTGFFYGAAFTNSAVTAATPTATNNQIAAWANVGYNFTCPVTKGNATAGLNTGYIAENAQILGADKAIGLNPYLTLTAGKWTGIAEIISWNLQPDVGNDVTPTGINLTVAYKINDKVEPVVRFSHLDTDGVGITNAGAVFGAQANGAVFYDKVDALYLGANYYIYGHSLKVQAGYEYSKLKDSLNTNSEIDANAIRVQIQAMF